MGNVDCKVECHYCKEVFIVPSLTHPLPAHKHLGAMCPGSNKPGLFLSIHQKKQPYTKC
jgi:hypothetical protein